MLLPFGTGSVALSRLDPVLLQLPVWHLFSCTCPYRGLTVVTLSCPGGAFGFTRTLLAGIPTYTWYGRTSLVATAIAPTIACSFTCTPASTVAWYVMRTPSSSRVGTAVTSR